MKKKIDVTIHGKRTSATINQDIERLMREATGKTVQDLIDESDNFPEDMPLSQYLDFLMALHLAYSDPKTFRSW